MPSALGEAERGYIIAHEQQHIHRLDHIIKLVAYIALTLHWFNPLVWVAYILFCKDMEMSCDERVIRKMGGHIRADYSASLLNLATGRRILSVTPLAFGEGDPKGRIKNLAKWKRPLPWVIALSLLVCLTTAGCLITDQPTEPTEPPTELEMVKEAWNDAVVERTVPVESIMVSPGALYSSWPHYKEPKNIFDLLDICTELNVEALQEGRPEWNAMASMPFVTIITPDMEIIAFVETGNVFVMLRKGETWYYAHCQSSSLTREDFNDYMRRRFPYE